MDDINENLGAVIYIMLGRIYDMLLLLADASGKGEDALQLRRDGSDHHQVNR